MKPVMPELYVGGMTDRQIRRHNQLIREEAIDRGKTKFMGACRKHGHVMFTLEKNKGKLSHRCLDCKKEHEIKKRMSRVLDKEDYPRKVWNREQLYKALRDDLTEVMLDCRHHGLTLHSIECSSKRTYCRICHRARIYAYRDKNGRTS